MRLLTPAWKITGLAGHYATPTELTYVQPDPGPRFFFCVFVGQSALGILAIAIAAGAYGMRRRNNRVSSSYDCPVMT